MGRHAKPLTVKPPIQDNVVPTEIYLILFKPPREKQNYPPRAFAYVRQEERESKLAFLIEHGFNCVTRNYKLAR